MKPNKYNIYFLCVFLTINIIIAPNIIAQERNKDQNIDKKVKEFFVNHQRSWRDMNVPESDGKLLYDLIIKNKYTKALEIGTSTGYSSIWIAWALSKTGGKLITIEIDERRQKEALANFKEAGLSDFIDSRLADAHKLVKEIEGPFDFIFCDADKGWYKNYFIDVISKLSVNGCYTAHNISNSSRYGGRGRSGGTSEYFEYVKGLKYMETTHNSNGGGMSISYKRSKN